VNIDKTKEHVLFFVIVNDGIGSKVLDVAKKNGVNGGTIFLGRGTVKSHILEILGLNESKKEIVMMICESELENYLHEVFSKEFHLEKHNHGIAFSISVKKVLGLSETKSSFTNDSDLGGPYDMEHEVIFTIVERGLGQDVVDAANAAGSTGATIIDARGSGIHENVRFFSMRIEPEKEIVMIITEKAKSNNIVEAIKEKMKIEEPGNGILFVMDVNKTSGLVKSNK